jgi:hypothetical protein
LHEERSAILLPSRLGGISPWPEVVVRLTCGEMRRRWQVHGRPSPQLPYGQSGMSSWQEDSTRRQLLSAVRSWLRYFRRRGGRGIGLITLGYAQCGCSSGSRWSGARSSLPSVSGFASDRNRPSPLSSGASRRRDVTLLPPTSNDRGASTRAEGSPDGAISFAYDRYTAAPRSKGKRTRETGPE